MKKHKKYGGKEVKNAKGEALQPKGTETKFSKENSESVQTPKTGRIEYPDIE